MAPPARGVGGSVPPAPSIDVGGEGGGAYIPAPPPFPFTFHLMEVTLISAQDLYPASRSMRTYAVAYLRHDHRVRTHVDTSGHTDPNWTDKFVFRVDDAVLRSDTAALTIDVYATRSGLLPGPDHHLGTARALISTLRPSSATHYAALQVRRPTSLRPQGILNLSAALVDPNTRCSHPHADHGPSPTPKPEVPKPKRRTAGAGRAAGRERTELEPKRPHAGATRPADQERTELEKQLERWRAELPPASGEVVRVEKGGPGRGGGAAPVDDRLSRLQGRRSFRKLACFGGENLEAGEFVAAAPAVEFVAAVPPRIVKERPAKRGARDTDDRN